VAEEAEGDEEMAGRCLGIIGSLSTFWSNELVSRLQIPFMWSWVEERFFLRHSKQQCLVVLAVLSVTSSHTGNYKNRCYGDKTDSGNGY